MTDLIVDVKCLGSDLKFRYNDRIMYFRFLLEII